MYKKFCDRCGKLITVDQDALEKYVIHKSERILDEHPEEGPFVHLCSECETEFETWLNASKEKMKGEK